MSSQPRPRIVVSRCLGFEACRYDGELIKAPFVDTLKPFVDFITVCPEMGIGLGVPRHPILLIQGAPGAELGLVQPATGRVLGKEMRAFTAAFLEGLAEHGGVDGFILKSRSPSCGPGDCKIYSRPRDEEPTGLGWGLFAALVKERFPDVPLLCEEELDDSAQQKRFLAQLVSLGRPGELE
jgi:uncharacterized protein YbbK (DUF523 family)